jgi:hypothetical protein
LIIPFAENDSNMMHKFPTKEEILAPSEFFIASQRCLPGGQRFHANILLLDFDNAIGFASNPDCYNVFFYGWDLFVWHFKVIDGKAKLCEEINLNEYILGAIDANDCFIPVEIIRKYDYDNNREKALKEIYTYKKVVYQQIPPIVLRNPVSISEKVMVKIPDQTREYVFKPYHGYQWEDSSDLICYVE